MSMKRYYDHTTGKSGYIDVNDRPAFDASRVTGCGCDASYNFGNFALHAVIAAITGGLIGAFTDSTIIGILAGIASLVICIFIHVAKEQELSHVYHKDAIVKHIIGYIMTIGISIGAFAIVCSTFGLGITIIATIGIVIIDILIIKKIDA